MKTLKIPNATFFRTSNQERQALNAKAVIQCFKKIYTMDTNPTYLCTVLFLFLVLSVNTIFAQEGLRISSLAPFFSHMELTDPQDSTDWPLCDPVQEVLVSINSDSSVVIDWDTSYQGQFEYDLAYGRASLKTANLQSETGNMTSFNFDPGHPFRDGNTVLKIRRICEDKGELLKSKWLTIHFNFPKKGKTNTRAKRDNQLTAQSSNCVGPVVYTQVPDCLFPVVCGISERILFERVTRGVRVYLSSPITEIEKQQLADMNVANIGMKAKSSYPGYEKTNVGCNVITIDVNNGGVLYENQDVDFIIGFETERIDSTLVRAELTIQTENNDPAFPDIQVLACENNLQFAYSGTWPYAVAQELFNTSCNNGIDDDNDGLTDGADPDCAQNYYFQFSELSVSNCVNGGRIFGSLLNSSGLVDQVDISISSNAYGLSSSGGSFQFDQLPPNAYQIQARDINSNQVLITDTVFLFGNCGEICSNGYDEDGDGLIDCEDGDCFDLNGEVRIASVDPSCSAIFDGSLMITLIGNDPSCVEISIDGGQNFVNQDSFPGLPAGLYEILVRFPGDGRMISGGAVLLKTAICGEICDNGIDDDGDGNIDCLDGECGPILNNILLFEGDCDNDNLGRITIEAAGPNLEYSIDNGGSFHSNPIFDSLTPGNYFVLVQNSSTGCQTIPVEQIIREVSCQEICNNGIDDDGDGLVDCADDDCENGFTASLTITQPTLANCPNADDGQISVLSTMMEVEYSVDSGLTYQNSSNFDGLFPDTYHVIVRHLLSNCEYYVGEFTLQTPACVEICDNGLDDDMDGLVDCDDPDCANSIVPDTSICNLLMYLKAAPLANNQALLFFDSITQVNFDMLFNAQSNNAIVTATYSGLDGFLTQSLTLYEDGGDSIDVATWSFVLFDVQYDSLISLTIEQFSTGSCAVSCSDSVQISVPQIADSVEIKVEENPEVELPIFNCGDSLTLSTVDTTTILQNLQAGEIFYIYGFPILVSSVNPLGSGVFSGEGIIPLPFNKKTLKVSFTGVSVNADRQIFSGTVSGMAGSFNPVDFSADTFSVGGEICLPPSPKPGYDQEGFDEVTGLNEWGFDSTGVHSETGTDYDPSGFDAEGVHEATGTEYNPEGCNREGRDENDNPCDPAGATSPEVAAFVDTIKDQLPDDVADQIDSLVQSKQEELALMAAQCQTIRTSLDSILIILNYDSTFIFGENNKYLNKGMSDFFESPPESLIQNVERNESTIALEDQHIELYDCDKNELLLEALLSELSLLQSGDQSDLVDQILEEIRKLPKEVVATFSDPDTFQAWLEEKIMELTLSTEETIGHLEPEVNFYQEDHSIDYDQWYSVVASVDDGLLVEASNSAALAQLEFEFRQGFKYINGVHRAYYLEAIGNAREEVTMAMEERGLFPIEVTKVIGGKEITIYLDNVSVTTTGGFCDAYLILDDLQNKGNRLVFEGLGIGFGPTGLTGSSFLSLISQVEIKLSNTAQLILTGGGTNYVEWDCQGFVGLNMDAQIELCRNFVIPLDEATLEPKPDPELYRLSFSTYVDNWFDFTIGVDAPPFQMAGAANVKWEIDSMYIDMSDGYTPSFRTPFGYNSAHLLSDGVLSPLWRGFYVKELTSTFPNQFRNDSSDVTVGVQDLIIDGCGVSTQVFAENLIAYEEGNLGGWAFSIDKLSMNVLHNHIAGGGFGGEINVPVFENTMSYEAVIYPNERYEFVVTPNEKDTMNLFLAEAVISENSKVEIAYIEDEFLAVATLSGELKIKAPDTARVKFTLPEVHFCDFRISNQAPYFDAGRWSIEGADELAINFAGFGADVSNITPIQGDSVSEAGLSFDLGITLAEDIGLSASGRFAIIGELIEENNRQKWVYKKTQVQQVYIDQTIKEVCTVKGYIEFFDQDPTYGDGFYGLVSADFIDLGLKVDASGMFGKVNDYKYFFVDALADLPIAIGAGPVNITGFGGGLSYHMDSDFDLANITFENGIPEVTIERGVSFSGVTYTPAEDLGIGIKASALLASAKEEIFNGSVSIEFIFNTIEAGGGLHKLAILGNGHFLKPLDLSKAPTFVQDAVSKPDREAAISAFLDLELNFTDEKFSGDLAVFLYAAGGIIRGAGKNNSLCIANILFSPDEWYINIGTPDNRCGILIQVPLVGSAELNAYLDVGSIIPDFPKLPENVRQLAGSVKSNEGLRKSGAGFIFGAELDVAIDAKFGPARGFLKAGLGFDIMLRNYGDAMCSGSSEQVGMDGWYAAGQMWGYMEGGVSLFGIPILEAGVATVFQARLPNPFWAQATLGVRIKVLFVEKSFNVPVEFGEYCILVSNDPNDLIGIKVISHTNPLDGSPDSPTDLQPEIYFSVPVHKEFELPGASGASDRYEAIIKEIQLTTKDNYAWPLRYELSEDGLVAKVIPGNLLPAFDTLTMISIVEIRKNGSFFAEERDTTMFDTGEGYDYIPLTNVEHAYPLDGMYNFYPYEYSRQQGFIQLISGQPDLLYPDDGSVNKVKIESKLGAPYYAEASYDAFTNKLAFSLDPTIFTANQLCKLTLVNVPETGDESELYAGLYFRVSEYATFKDKVDAIESAPFYEGTINGISLRAPEIGKSLDGLELMGQNEVDGRLVNIRADLNNDWINNQINPLIYDLFPFDKAATCETIVINNQGFDLSESAGIQSDHLIPISINQDQYNASLSAFNVSQQILYATPKVISAHHRELLAKVQSCVQLIMEESEEIDPKMAAKFVPDELAEFVNTEFPDLPSGTYVLQITYQLPDGTKTTYDQLSINYTNTQN